MATKSIVFFYIKLLTYNMLLKKTYIIDFYRLRAAMIMSLINSFYFRFNFILLL